jgi:hypothetical protein
MYLLQLYLLQLRVHAPGHVCKSLQNFIPANPGATRRWCDGSCRASLERRPSDLRMIGRAPVYVHILADLTTSVGPRGVRVIAVAARQ